MTPIDAAWLRDHPLPSPGGETDKNERGRVLAVGGSLLCPGALALTGAAAFRAGAGKVQMATVAAAALLLGIAMPEGAVIGLPANDDGELAAAGADRLAALLDRVDVAVIGPGMGREADAADLVRAMLAARGDIGLVLDAAAMACADSFREAVAAHGGPLVLTPHHGEMATCLGLDERAVAEDPEGVAAAAAKRFEAVVALKAGRTVVAAPDGTLLRYAGGGVGLATGGSGDVLAGIIAGLMARGTPALEATAWGVWLHGEAGRRLAEAQGPIGFLARELPPLVPGLMRGV